MVEVMHRLDLESVCIGEFYFSAVCGALLNGLYHMFKLIASVLFLSLIFNAVL